MTRWAKFEEQRIDKRESSAYGQVGLTEQEQSQVPLGNQYTDKRHKSICKWQVVKAAAMANSVSDWTAKVDPALTYLENVKLMEQFGVQGGSTMKELQVASARLMRDTVHRDLEDYHDHPRLRDESE